MLVAARDWSEDMSSRCWVQRAVRDPITGKKVTSPAKQKANARLPKFSNIGLRSSYGRCRVAVDRDLMATPKHYAAILQKYWVPSGVLIQMVSLLIWHGSSLNQRFLRFTRDGLLSWLLHGYVSLMT